MCKGRRVLFKDDLDLEASFDPSRDGPGRRPPGGDQTKSDNAEDDDIRVRRRGTSLGAQKQPETESHLEGDVGLPL